MTTILTGQLLADRYAVGRRLGQGGMAIVYEAIDQRTGRTVAVKVLNDVYAADAEGRRRFAAEARAAARLRHPQIVRILAYSLSDPPFIVYEYVDGPNLKDYLRRHGPLSLAATIAIVEQVTAALDHAHRNGIVHRDVKPQNILISHDQPPARPDDVTARLDLDGQPAQRDRSPADQDAPLSAKVTDFGIARAIDATSQTAHGTIFGSVAYLAPELVAGEKATPASDVYSLAAVAYELLAGRPPFEAENPYGVLSRKLREPAPGFRRERPEIPAAVEAVILAGLDRNPRRRPATAGEFARQLRAAGHGRRAVVPLPIGALLPRGFGATLQEGLRTGLPRGTQTVGRTLGRLSPSSSARSRSPRVASRLRGPSLRGILPAALIAALVLLIVVGTALALRGADAGIASDQIPAPRLVGQTLDEAGRTAQLSDLRLVQGPGRPDEMVPPDVIVDQEPAPDRPVARGSAITVTASLGPAQRAIPDLIDLSLDEAKRTIESAGFALGEVSYEYQPGSPPDRVLNQEPAAGELHPPGNPINLTVADHQPPAPPPGPTTAGPTTAGPPPANAPPANAPTASVPPAQKAPPPDTKSAAEKRGNEKNEKKRSDDREERRGRDDDD